MTYPVIRSASTFDMPAICTIEDDSFPTPYPRYLLERFLQYYGETFYVATDKNGETAGYCVCSVDSNSAHLISIAVRRDFRRKGLATALLQRLVKQLTQKGVGEMHLEVSVNNTEAIALYAKAGFEKLSTTPNYYSDGTDAAIMRLIIGDKPLEQSRDSD